MSATLQGIICKVCSVYLTHERGIFCVSYCKVFSELSITTELKGILLQYFYRTERYVTTTSDCSSVSSVYLTVGSARPRRGDPGAARPRGPYVYIYIYIYTYIERERDR